jgi:hypothetical protein
VKLWGPSLSKSFEDMQRAFWSGMGMKDKKD